MKVKELMREAHFVDANDSVAVAARALVDHKVSAVLVREGGQPVGIVTERDLLKFVAKCSDVSKVKVKTIMGMPLICVHADQNVLDACKLMQDKDVRHVAVTSKSGEIQGLITAKNISCNQVRLWQGRTLFD